MGSGMKTTKVKQPILPGVSTLSRGDRIRVRVSPGSFHLTWSRGPAYCEDGEMVVDALCIGVVKIKDVEVLQ